MNLALDVKRTLRSYSVQLGTEYKELAQEARELLARAEETGEDFDELFEEMLERLNESLTRAEIAFVEGARDGWRSGQCSSCGRSNLSGVDMDLCGDCYRAGRAPAGVDDDA